jgi:hypothetical protein
MPIQLLVLLGAVALLANYWPQLVDWCSRSLIPWVREKAGEKAGDLLQTLVVWLDKGLVPVLAQIRRAWTFVRERILRLQRTYTKTSSDTVQVSTETILVDESGNAVRRVEEEEIDWALLPEDVREAMIKQGKQPAEVDVKALIEHKARERAKEEGIDLEIHD